MDNCLVTKLKGVVNDNSLPLLSYAQFIFDNTLTPTQTAQVNHLQLYVTEDIRTQILNPDNLSIEYGWNGGQLRLNIDVSTATPANTKGRILIPLDKITHINGLAGSGYAYVIGNISFRMSDVLRMPNLSIMTPISLKTYDNNYNLEYLSKNIALRKFDFGGYFLGDWTGDIVNFVDGLIANGLNTASNPVCIFDTGTNASAIHISVNGTVYTNYIHAVITSAGYNIYQVNSWSALEDYSSYTPVYTRQF